MESFLSLGANKPFQKCKDSLINGQDNTWAFFGKPNQLTSYQNVSGHLEGETYSNSLQLTMLSDEVLY